jgi:hypothetical protein
MDWQKLLYHLAILLPVPYAIELLLLGDIMDVIHTPPLPATLLELAGTIPAAASTATHAMLTNVWPELEYR